MELNTLFCLVLCVVFVKTDECEKNNKSMVETRRFKRAKYYSSPPPGAIKYYRRPPSYGFPKGVFSPTPPPNYMMEDEVPSYPQSGPYSSRPQHAIKRPNNDGLGDEDLNNIIKYLSKEDLDKIIEFSGHKESTKTYKSRDFDNSDEKFSLNGPYLSAYDRPDYRHANDLQDASQSKPAYIDAPLNINNAITNTALDAQESRYKVAYVNRNHESQVGNSFNDNNAKEVLLPRPVNLREDDDILGSFTRNVENVARAASSYKLGNFGDLPIMRYHHSKQFATDSYSVPHYSITSDQGSKNQSPQVEPAPHPSEARSQSDAHLKAIKIWTHKSSGQAYTLHDDGSLSIERPLKPKPIYGP